MNIEKEISLINNIVLNAVMHGADSGGSYDSNIDGLKQALNEWVKEKELVDYVVLEMDVDCDYGSWYVPQITEVDI